EPLQLCHVVRGEVGEAGGPEQLHGPLDLAGQDFDGPVPALPATGHQAVQVGPADQSEVGAHGDRCHDIGAVHDAGVEDDLRAAAELLGHVREHVERDRCPVQLPSAVVGQHDAVHAEVGDPAGVIEGLDALDHDLAGPLASNPTQIVEVHGRIEH